MNDHSVTHETSSDIEERLEDLKPDNACLVVIHGTNLGKKINLDKDEMLIGRAEDVDIRINEANISRKHAIIKRQVDSFVIMDNNSTNGTFVNTKRKNRAILHDQDLIMLGNTLLKFLSSDNLENVYHEELYKLATMDSFLQIYNRQYFLERLNDEFSRCQRYKRELSLVMFDLDHFKRINDVYGHQAGDFVLKKLAAIIKQNLRKEDTFGRYGGEEFTILLPETNLEQATTKTEILRQLIESSLFTYNDEEISLTISSGVASYLPLAKELHAYSDLIEKADQALYKAKRAGRNKVVCCDISDTSS